MIISVWMKLPCKPLRRDMITVASLTYELLQTFDILKAADRNTITSLFSLYSCRNTKTQLIQTSSFKNSLYFYGILFLNVILELFASALEMWYLNPAFTCRDPQGPPQWPWNLKDSWSILNGNSPHGQKEFQQLLKLPRKQKPLNDLHIALRPKPTMSWFWFEFGSTCGLFLRTLFVPMPEQLRPCRPLWVLLLTSDSHRNKMNVQHFSFRAPAITAWTFLTEKTLCGTRSPGLEPVLWLSKMQRTGSRVCTGSKPEPEGTPVIQESSLGSLDSQGLIEMPNEVAILQAHVVLTKYTIQTLPDQ